MRVSLSTARWWMANMWRARVRKDPGLHPVAVTWHATNACNFRCDYCDDGRGRAYPEVGGRTLDTAGAMEVLSLAREAVDMLYITGGEPLLRNDLGKIVHWAKRDARFRFVGLATNGVLLPRQESLLAWLDQLEISFDSRDRDHYDRVLGAGPGAAAAVEDAVVRYHGLQASHGYEFSVTCVARPGRISDARDVLAFCIERGIRCAILPESDGPYPVPGLGQDPEYAAFIDDVVAAKRRGAPVNGSDLYYAHIRQFVPFRCYPTLVPRILPNGDLYYPCAPLGTIAGSLVGARSFMETLAAGATAHGPLPRCDARCFATCYIETSASITSPMALGREYLQLRPRRTRV